MSSRPASILERSRTSLIRSSSCDPHLAIASSASRCAAFRLRSRCRSWAYPSTPFSGVLSSWLMLARNSLLARVAASADSFARRSSASRSRRSEMSRRNAPKKKPPSTAIGDVMVSSTGNSRPDRFEGRQFEALIDDRRLAGFVKAPHAAVVRLAKRRRDDRLGQVPAEHLVARPSERLLRPERSTRQSCPSSRCR